MKAWEEEYRGAEKAVPWNIVCTLIESIDHICSYRDDAEDNVKNDAP
jgi:hypothetical protein